MDVYACQFPPPPRLKTTTRHCLQLDESDRRYKSHLGKIKDKAFEMSILRHSTDDNSDALTPVPYETKEFCSVCNVMVRALDSTNVLS